jgi:RNA polymerase II subunit A small phosphatase-like protein
MQALMSVMERSPRRCLHSLCSEVTDLRKFAVLNYIAVIKAVKKRNRHMAAKVGAAVKPMRAVELLNQQYFYTSPKLAALATQGEILMQVGLVVTRQCRHESSCASCPKRPLLSEPLQIRPRPGR